jgi:hypothetical protein
MTLRSGDTGFDVSADTALSVTIAEPLTLWPEPDPERRAVHHEVVLHTVALRDRSGEEPEGSAIASLPSPRPRFRVACLSHCRIHAATRFLRPSLKLSYTSCLEATELGQVRCD